jgi:hypothetical protein
MARNIKGADLELPDLRIACTVNSLIYVTSELGPIGVYEYPEKETFHLWIGLRKERRGFKVHVSRLHLMLWS